MSAEAASSEGLTEAGTFNFKLSYLHGWQVGAGWMLAGGVNSRPHGPLHKAA